MTSLLKRSALSVLASAAVGRWLAASRGDRCLILMLHRFAGPGGVPYGHDARGLRATLAYLRASGIRLLELDEAITEFADPSRRGSVRRAAVAFTVDDGYRDLATVGLPVFAEFDCPVTSFVVPDVIDGKTWFWWDRLDWQLRQLEGRVFTVELGAKRVAVAASDPITSIEWQQPLRDRLRRSTPAGRQRFLDELEQLSGVSCPERAPDEYGVLSWQALRDAERRGVRFGAHSMSHPVLSQCTDEESRYEILESSRRLRVELATPSKVFCYPYGDHGEFGVREGRYVREAGMSFAVTTEPGRVSPYLAVQHQTEWEWQVPRFALDSRPGVIARNLFL